MALPVENFIQIVHDEMKRSVCNIACVVYVVVVNVHRHLTFSVLVWVGVIIGISHSSSGRTIDKFTVLRIRDQSINLTGFNKSLFLYQYKKAVLKI